MSCQLCGEDHFGSTCSGSRVVDRAWKLLDGRWTRGSYARDSEGRAVAYEDPRAVKFCALGAIFAVHGKDRGEVERSKLQESLKKGNSVAILPFWNDNSDEATVVAKLKELDI